MGSHIYGVTYILYCAMCIYTYLPNQVYLKQQKLLWWWGCYTLHNTTMLVYSFRYNSIKEVLVAPYKVRPYKGYNSEFDYNPNRQLIAPTIKSYHYKVVKSETHNGRPNVDGEKPIQATNDSNKHLLFDVGKRKVPLNEKLRGNGSKTIYFIFNFLKPVF